MTVATADAWVCGAPEGRDGFRAAVAGSPGLPVVAAGELAEVRGALDALARRLALGAVHTRGSRAEWAGLVAACQSVVNTATAVQDVAMTRLSAIEEEWLEDGTTTETRRPPGHVALDAPDIVAGALGVSHAQAQRRVALAVSLVAHVGAAGGDGPGPGETAGLSQLHEAMAAGHLDGYRASVVAEELAEAPSEVAEAVVGVLVPHLGVETSVQLRRRCRRALARISPDLLRQRARRAREGCGLRRWVEEPGVDRWEGTFPSEQAAEGWAAVDALARRYVADGRCRGVEAARATALMDLIRGQASVEVQLVVTVPASTIAADGTVAEPRGGSSGRSIAGASEAMRPGVGDSIATMRPPRAVGGDGEPVARAGVGAGAGAGPADGPPGAVAGVSLEPDRGPDAAAVTAAPAPCGSAAGGRTPAATAPSTLVVGPYGPAPSTPGRLPLSVGDVVVVAVSDDDDDLVEVSGPLPGDPVLVERRWVASFLRGVSTRRPRSREGPSPTAPSPTPSRPTPARTTPSSPTPSSPTPPWVHASVEGCHPVTGALLGSTVPARGAYRPGSTLAALVRARDGRCRFPGCSVAARFCDLDHVRPWPTGSTSADNLLCLCRRHHRIKQRVGWSVRLAPDARAVWTDPTGRVRTSWPRDLLDVVVLPAQGVPTASEPVETRSPRDAGTALEAFLEVWSDHEVRRRIGRGDGCRRLQYVDDRRCHVRRTSSGGVVERRATDPPRSGPPPF